MRCWSIRPIAIGTVAGEELSATATERDTTRAKTMLANLFDSRRSKLAVTAVVALAVLMTFTGTAAAQADDLATNTEAVVTAIFTIIYIVGIAVGAILIGGGLLLRAGDAVSASKAAAGGAAAAAGMFILIGLFLAAPAINLVLEQTMGVAELVPTVSEAIGGVFG